MDASKSTAQISWEYVVMPKRKEQAAVYPRVSDESLKESPTLENQEKTLRVYCANVGYDLADQHVYPEAMTAYMKPYRERPRFMEMIAAAKRREFDVLVVTEFSRISRHQIEQAVIIDLLSKYGVRVESITEPFDTSPIGIFMRNVFAFIAEVEREKIYWRTMRGVRDRCENGKVLTGKGMPLYGYQWANTPDYTSAYYVFNLDVIYTDTNGHVWTEVMVVKFIYNQIYQGCSIRNVALTLTQLQIPTRKGKGYWFQSTIQQILANPAYMGKAVAFRWKRDNAKGYSVLRDAEEHLILPEGVIPPIIDEALWHAVQEQLQRNREESPRGNKWPKDVLLRAGLVRCGICGGALRVKNLPHHNGRINRYVCQNGSYTDKHSVNIGAKTLDEAAWNFATTYILNPLLIKERIEQLRSQTNTNINKEGIEGVLGGIKKRMKNLYALAQDANDDETIASLKALLHDLERQKREAQALLYQSEEEAEKAQELQEELTKFEEWTQRIQSSLLDPLFEPTYEQKRTAIKILGITAIIWPMDAEKRFELRLAPPSLVSVLSR